MPGSRQRPGLRLAISNDSSNDQLGIVESGATRVGQHIPKFTALMDRAWRFGSAVAPDASGKRKLLEELAQAFEVFALVGIHLGVRSFQITRSKNTWGAVPRSGKKDHVEVVFLDQPIEVYIDKRQPWARSPMPEQPVLDVFWSQRLREQRIIEQVNHSQAEIIASPPVSVRLPQFIGAERRSSH